MICANCVHWTMGDTWGTNFNGRDHGVTIECKGWCLAKPNKRKVVTIKEEKSKKTSKTWIQCMTMKQI